MKLNSFYVFMKVKGFLLLFTILCHVDSCLIFNLIWFKGRMLMSLNCTDKPLQLHFNDFDLMTWENLT